MQFVLEAHVVSIKFSFDAKERTDVRYSLDCLAVSVVHGAMEVAGFNVLDEALVVIQSRSWSNGYMTSVGLHYYFCNALDVFRKEA